MKKRLIIILLCILFLAAGCNLSTSATKNQSNEDFIGYITQLDLENNKVLINDIWFSFNSQTDFFTDKNKRLHKDNLEIGKKVNVKAEGEIKESFPAQTYAKSLVFLTDSQSKKEEIAVELVLRDPRFSQVVLHSIEKNPTGMYSVRFKDLSISRDVHVLVNLDEQRVIVPINTSSNN